MEELINKNDSVSELIQYLLLRRPEEIEEIAENSLIEIAGTGLQIAITALNAVLDT